MALIDHQIDPAAAGILTRAYRDAHPGAIIAGYFSNDAVQAILNQAGTLGVRYYYGQDPVGDPCLVVVGVDAANNDQVDGIIIEMSLPCPKMCSAPNILNSNN